MYVMNANPNLVNYQYTNSSDLNSAVQLLETYMVVVKSAKVMNVVAENLANKYYGITADFIKGTISMGSVQETGVLRIRSTTRNAQLSADICNTVLDVAPQQIKDVVGAGQAEPIDYADVPYAPDFRSPTQRGLFGALGGAVLAIAVLATLFLLNHKVADKEVLEENYTPPVLASIKRSKKNNPDPVSFLLNDDSPMELVECYAKLRMNLLYTLVGKDNKVVALTSAISGEGKSTITANLAISCAMSGKQVLLIDADMRRACQKDHFKYGGEEPGLSEVLIGSCSWWEAVLNTEYENLVVLPAGHLPPNPAELLSLPAISDLVSELQQHFDLVLIDTPPVNVVADPLILSSHVAGCVLVVRQNYSNHREIKKTLTAAEMTGMNVLGFAFYGENIKQGRYYGDKYYSRYYNKYDNRKHKSS